MTALPPAAAPLPQRPAEAPPSLRPEARTAALLAGGTTFALALTGMTGNLLVLNLGTGAIGADGAPLLRIAVVAFLLTAVLDIVLAWALMRVFGDRHGGLATLAGWLRVGYAAALAAAVGSLATAADRASGGDAAGAGVAVQAFGASWQLALVVFAAHLVVLGLLVLHDAVPSWLGAVLLLAGTGYAIDGTGRLFLPADAALLGASAVVLAAASIVGEGGMGVWFLLRGGRDR